jgi:hypothetical protein
MELITLNNANKTTSIELLALNKKPRRKRPGAIFPQLWALLFYLVYDGFKRLRMIHREVSKNLAV